MSLLTINHAGTGLRRKAAVRRGAQTVEFAVIASVLFLFILGLIEVGRGIMVQHLLTNAARQGCRVGTIEGKSNSDVTAAVQNALSGQGINAQALTVQVNDGTADVATANPGDEVTVIVTVPVGSVSWVPGTNFLSGNLSGRYTLRRE
jgi:Flp pilus assembly protein TadG